MASHFKTEEVSEVDTRYETGIFLSRFGFLNLLFYSNLTAAVEVMFIKWELI